MWGVVYINVQTSVHGSRAARSNLAARSGVGRGYVVMGRTVMYTGQASMRGAYVARSYLHRDREVVCAVVYMMLYMYVVRSEWGADVGRVQGKM